MQTQYQQGALPKQNSGHALQTAAALLDSDMGSSIWTARPNPKDTISPCCSFGNMLSCQL